MRANDGEDETNQGTLQAYMENHNEIPCTINIY
jgi:hypothetical protein